MTAFFVAILILGLLVAVRVMFFGIEHPQVDQHSLLDGAPGPRPRIRTWYAAAAAFAVVFGVVGYLLDRSGATAASSLGFAVAAGAAVAALAGWGAVAWARVVPEHDVEDPRYVLQGHLALVTAPIAADREGEITFEIGSERRTVRARVIDDSSVAVGAEVVIERIDDEIAYVEPWQQVEKRL